MRLTWSHVTCRSGCVAAFVFLFSVPARSQGIAVFDAPSYAALIRELSQGAQQLSDLEQQLMAELAVIKTLPASSFAGLTPLITQTEGLVNQIQGIGGLESGLLSNLDQSYPTHFTEESPSALLNTMTQMQRQDRQAIATAMQIQNEVAQLEPGITARITTAEGQSAAASGPTEALQATNQLMGSVASQLAEQNALDASAIRAEEERSLESESRNAWSEHELAPANAPMNGKGF